MRLELKALGELKNTDLCAMELIQNVYILSFLLFLAFMEPKGSGNMMKEQMDFINDSLVYLFEAKRGKEEGKTVLTEVKNTVATMGKVLSVVQQRVSEWPQKFPEVHYPQMFLELNSLVPEEELLVAVCSNLKISSDDKPLTPSEC